MESRRVPLSLLASETVHQDVLVPSNHHITKVGQKSFEDGQVMSGMSVGYHIPGHLPSVLPSMTKAGRYIDASQWLFIIAIVALSRDGMPLHREAVSNLDSMATG